MPFGAPPPCPPWNRHTLQPRTTAAWHRRRERLPMAWGFSSYATRSEPGCNCSGQLRVIRVSACLSAKRVKRRPAQIGGPTKAERRARLAVGNSKQPHRSGGNSLHFQGTSMWAGGTKWAIFCQNSQRRLLCVLVKTRTEWASGNDPKCRRCEDSSHVVNNVHRVCKHHCSGNHSSRMRKDTRLHLRG